MYSPKLETLFKRKRIRIGSRIIITKSRKSHEGLLMPKTEMGDPDSVVIKLDSGYNIGIKYAAGVKVEKSRGETPDSI